MSVSEDLFNPGQRKGATEYFPGSIYFKLAANTNWRSRSITRVLMTSSYSLYMYVFEFHNCFGVTFDTLAKLLSMHPPLSFAPPKTKSMWGYLSSPPERSEAEWRRILHTNELFITNQCILNTDLLFNSFPMQCIKYYPNVYISLKIIEVSNM